MKRPENVYVIKGDRSKSTRYVSAPVMAGMRVHFRFECDAQGTHRVSRILWEHEVPDFVKNVTGAGATLVASPSRPNGIETVLGWTPPPAPPKPDPREVLLKMAFRFGRKNLTGHITEAQFAAAMSFLDGLEDAELKAELWCEMKRGSQTGQ